MILGPERVTDQKRVKIKEKIKPSKKSKELWEKSQVDLVKGYANGPFQSESDVTNFLGTESWHMATRFPHVSTRPFMDDNNKLGYKIKMRTNDDDAASNLNKCTFVKEKMRLSSVDRIAAAAELMTSLGKDNLVCGPLDISAAFNIQTAPLALPSVRFTAAISSCVSSCNVSGKKVFFNGRNVSNSRASFALLATILS